VARKKNTPIDSARQALIKAVKGASKEQKRKVSKLSREWQRTRAAALKQQRKNVDKDLVAQWRALRKLGYVKTTVAPSQKALTPSRRKEIRRIFRQAQSQGTLINGRVVRPLVKTPKVITTKWRDVSGREHTTVTTRINYQLAPNFKLVKSKNKPSTTRGITKTRKGYIVAVESPLSKVRITPKGQVIEKTEYESGGITVSREGVTGKDILSLVEAIERGKFKLPAGRGLKMLNFGTDIGRIYGHDALDLFAERFRYYERAMASRVFDFWMDTIELQIVSQATL
jgi:hypothetical protein